MSDDAHDPGPPVSPRPVAIPASAEVRRGNVILEPADDNQDGRPDTVWVDPDGPDGPAPSVERPAAWVRSRRGRVKVAIMDMEPVRPPTVHDLFKEQQDAFEAQLARANGYARRLWKWFVGMGLGGVVSIAALVYYIVFIASAVTGVTTIYECPPEAAAWLETEVKPLLDEPDNPDDEYDRGRKALGLED